MITYLRGEALESSPGKLTLLVGGVGYEINVPKSYQFDTEEQISLMTHLVVREDAHVLYGFRSRPEKDLFLMLVQKVSGIGPSIAIAFLDGITVAEFKHAISNNLPDLLSKIKGVGKKTAEKVIFELRDKVGIQDTWTAEKNGEISASAADAELALIALGYKQKEAKLAVQNAIKRSSTALDTPSLIRLALKEAQ